MKVRGAGGLHSSPEEIEMNKFVTLALTLLMVAAIISISPPETFAGEKEDARKAEESVRNYEERIESLAKEVAQIRADLETLTREMLEGETGRVFVFMKARVSDWKDRGVALVIDGKTVFSRPLTTSELSVLGGDLPLEILDIRLTAGNHEVALGAVGVPLAQGVKLNV